MLPERATARGIVLSEEGVILIRRVKKGSEYWVTPGGGIEEGETPEVTMHRETREELEITIDNARLVLEVRSIVNGVLQHDYYFTGKLAKGTGNKIAGPESERANGDNIYDPRTVTLAQLDDINLVPDYVKALIKRILMGENVDFMELNLLPSG